MHRGLFALLCLSVWINYAGRGSLGVAAPIIRPELGLSVPDTGYLLAGFFWTYASCQPIGGWLVDRRDVYRAYALAFAAWSVAVAATSLATGFWTMMLARLALGAGQSVAFPAYSRILANSFAEGHRGLANALIDAGTKAGPALATFAGGLAIEQWGWRSYLLWLGIGSLLWLIPWWILMPRAPVASPAAVSAVPSGKVLAQRQACVTFAGLFAFNYAFYFLLTWLPGYLVSARGYSLRDMAAGGALPFLATAASSLFTGAWVDRRIRSGADAGEQRRRVAVVGLLVCAALLPVAAFAPAYLLIGALMLACVGMGMFTANVWAITQTLAGPSAAGTWTGWQNAVGNLGGVVAPIVTAWSVEWTGAFVSAFVIAALMLIASAACYGLALGRVSPVAWRTA